jgi:hypothetical protein
MTDYYGMKLPWFHVHYSTIRMWYRSIATVIER